MSDPAPSQRLATELRVLGLLGLAWSLSAAFELAVASALVEFGPRPGPWGQVAAAHLLGALVAAIGLAFELPTSRWPAIRTRPVGPLAVAGALLLGPVAAWLWLRDRAARGEPPAKESIDRSFFALLRVPRSLSLRFLTWHGLAALVSAIVLGTHAGWARSDLVAVSLLWVGLASPWTALLVAWSRTTLRPELLDAPRPLSEFQLRADLRTRLAVNGTVAALGVIAAPLLAAYLVHSAGHAEAAPRRAHATAERLMTLATAGPQEELGRELGRQRGAVVQVGHQRFGDLTRPIPSARGSIDLDDDGAPDLVVLHGAAVSVVVPIDPGAPDALPLLLSAVVGIVACMGAAVFLVARDLDRDVVRAATQVGAVAQGHVPAPLREGTFSTAELRQLVQAVDRLVHRLTEANIARYVAIEKSKEADRLKNQFLANMSHDLRSPLNSILGFSELLLSGIEGTLAPEQREMVQHIHDSGKVLLQQIDDILDTAKIEAGRLELHPEPTPAAELVNRAIASANKRRDDGIHHEVDIAAGLPPAFVDPFRTGQAIENVLLFASERMTEGTVQVRVRVGKGDRGRMLVIQIRTPVRPASAPQLARARRGFYRIPGHRGLGLGLPIAGAILELQGGALSIEDLGEGDGMIFTLQLSAPSARRATGPIREVVDLV